MADVRSRCRRVALALRVYHGAFAVLQQSERPNADAAEAIAGTELRGPAQADKLVGELSDGHSEPVIDHQEFTMPFDSGKVDVHASSPCIDRVQNGFPQGFVEAVVRLRAKFWE